MSRHVQQEAVHRAVIRRGVIRRAVTAAEAIMWAAVLRQDRRHAVQWVRAAVPVTAAVTEAADPLRDRVRDRDRLCVRPHPDLERDSEWDTQQEIILPIVLIPAIRPDFIQAEHRVRHVRHARQEDPDPAAPKKEDPVFSRLSRLLS